MFDVTMHSQFLLVLPFSETKTIHWEFFKISHEAEQWRWCHHEKHKHKNNAKKSTYKVKTGLSVRMKSMCVLCIDIKRLERDITFLVRLILWLSQCKETDVIWLTRIEYAKYLPPIVWGRLTVKIHRHLVWLEFVDIVVYMELHRQRS